MKRIEYYATHFFYDLLENSSGLKKKRKDKACQELQVASCRHCDVVEKAEPLQLDRPVCEAWLQS